MTGVVLGLRFTADHRELQAAADKGVAAIQRTGEAAKRANDESRRAAQQYTDTLRKQADTLGMSRSQVLAYEAAQHKLTDAQRQSVQASIQQINAYDKKSAILARVRIAAAAAGTALGVAFVAGAKAAVSAAAEAEQAQMRLEAVLRGTGYAAGFNGDQLDKMSTRMQDRLGIDGDEIKKSMAMLLTFRQVGRESFEEALTVAANISAVIGTDLQSSVLQLGKALEDPEQGLTALTRSGVSFTAAQKEMIKGMVETGNQAEAITTILQIMKSQGLDGIAEAMNTGVTGASNDLKNSWNDLLESIGKTPAVSGLVNSALSGVASSLKDIRILLDEGDWTDLAYIMNPLAFAGRGKRVAELRAGVEGREAQNARELARGGVGASVAAIEENRRVQAAQEKASEFLARFRTDNEKLEAELRKWNRLADQSNMTTAQRAEGEARIRAAAAKKGSQSASAGAQLISSLKEQIAQLEGDGGAYDKVMRQLADSNKKYTAAERESIEALALKLKTLSEAKVLNAAQVKAAEDLVRRWEQEGEVLARLNESMSQQAQGLQLEIDLMGASDAQREKTIALKQLENKFDREAAGLSAEKYEEAHRLYLLERDRISDLLDQRAGAQARKKALDDAKAEQKRFNDDLARGLTDSIFRGFEGGKSFARNFWDSMKNMAKTTILQPVVKFLVSPVTSAIGGALGAILPGSAGASSHVMGGGIGGGIGQGLGGLGNLGSLFSGDGLSALAGIPNAMFQNAGVSMGSQFIADIGNFGFGAPVMGGVMNLLAGNVKGAVGSAALGTLGTMFGGPIGGAIGSAVGSLFGGSKKTPAYFTSADVSAVANAQGGYVSSATANSQKGDRWGFNYDLASVIQGSIRDLYKEIDSLGTRLGRDTSALWTTQVPFSFKATGDMVGPTIEGAVAGFQESLGHLSDQLVRTVVPNLDAFAQAGETATQTLARMIMMQEQAQAQLTGAVRNLPGQLGITSLDGTRNALAMSEYVSPIDRLSTARSLLTDTYNRGLAGDLTAVSSYGSQLQQALTLGREVGASGPAFQALFQEGNRQLNDLLARQQQIQTEMLQGIDLSIMQAAQDQVAELKKGFKAMVDELAALRGDVRKLAA
jgi:hypothetical protein